MGYVTVSVLEDDGVCIPIATYFEDGSSNAQFVALALAQGHIGEPGTIMVLSHDSRTGIIRSQAFTIIGSQRNSTLRVAPDYIPHGIGGPDTSSTDSLLTSWPPRKRRRDTEEEELPF